MGRGLGVRTAERSVTRTSQYARRLRRALRQRPRETTCEGEDWSGCDGEMGSLLSHATWAIRMITAFVTMLAYLLWRHMDYWIPSYETSMALQL